MRRHRADTVELVASRHSVLSTKKMFANVSSDLGTGEAVPHRVLKRRAVDPVIGDSGDEWIGILHNYRPCLKKGVIIPRPISRNSPIPTLRDSSDYCDSSDIVDREISGLCSHDESISEDNFCPSPDIMKLSNSAPCLIHTDFPVTRSSTNPTNSTSSLISSGHHMVSDDNGVLFNFNSMLTAKLEEISSIYMTEIERCCASLVDSFDAKIRARLQTHKTPPPLPPPTPTLTPTYNITTRNRFDLLSSE